MKNVLVLIFALTYCTASMAQESEFNEMFINSRSENSELIEQKLKDFFEVYPNYTTGYAVVLDYYSESNDYTSLLEWSKKMIRYTAPDDSLNLSYACFNMSLAQGGLQQPDSALFFIELSIAYDTNNIYQQLYKPFFLTELGRFEEALSFCNERLQIYPKSGMFWYAITIVYIKMERFEEALATAKNLVLYEEPHEENFGLIAAIYEKLEDWSNSIYYYGEAISITNDWYDLAEKFIAVSMGDLEFANQYLENKLDSDNKEPWLYIRSNINFEIERYDAAYTDLSQLILLSTDELIYFYYKMRGIAGIKLQCYDFAIQDLEICSEKLPEDLIIMQVLADSYFYNGDFSKAITMYKKAIQMYPEDYYSYYLMASAKKAIFDYNGAIADYNVYLLNKPNDTRALLQRGRSFADGLFQINLAIKDYQTILNIDTVINPELNIRPFALFQLGKTREAKRWMQKVIRKYPNKPNYYNAACFYALTKNETRAVRMLSKAFENGFYSFKQLDTNSDLDSIRNNPKYQKLYTKWVSNYNEYRKKFTPKVESECYTEKIIGFQNTTFNRIQNTSKCSY